MTVVYDAGVLIGAERDDRTIWAEHRARLELGLAPLTTAPVVAQVSRSSRQVTLRRFLRGCVVAPFAPPEGHVVGALLAKAASADVVDAHVVVVAAARRATILTTDPVDVTRLSACLEDPVSVVGL